MVESVVSVQFALNRFHEIARVILQAIASFFIHNQEHDWKRVFYSFSDRLSNFECIYRAGFFASFVWYLLIEKSG